MNYKIALECGLISAGKNEDGELELMGTKSQWDKYTIEINKLDK